MRVINLFIVDILGFFLNLGGRVCKFFIVIFFSMVLLIFNGYVIFILRLFIFSGWLREIDIIFFKL